MRTRGRFTTGTRASPSDAMRPTSCGRKRRPARNAAVPLPMSSPTCPTCWPGATGRVISICPAVLGRVFGRHDRIELIRHRSARHDAYRCIHRHGIAERLARHRLAEHGKGEGIVFARPGGLGAAQRVAVHRRAIEPGHVERRDDVGGQDSTRGVLRRNALGVEQRAVSSDPLEDRRHLASAREAVHSHVGCGWHVARSRSAEFDRGRHAIRRRVPNEPSMLTGRAAPA